MAYTKTNWINDSVPAINAGNLNKIEQGIYDNSVATEENTSNIGNIDNLATQNKSDLVNAINEVNQNDINKSTYSTSEQVIGKWTNGKPIYRKVVTGTVPKSDYYPTVATGITNLDKVISISAVLAYGNNREYFSSTRYTYYLDKGDNKITIVTPDVEGDATFTICYTKTTD